MFASSKGKHHAQMNSTVTIVRNSVLMISRVTFRDCRVHTFSTTFLEIVYTNLLTRTFQVS